MAAPRTDRPDSAPGTSAPRPGRRPHRIDIQYLRAVAVGTVVVFHVWPSALPGGYIGVDVFFVISGFLITGQLLAEGASTGAIRLGSFWARRIRRLIPAAITVIVATLAASWFLLPRDTFRTVAEHAIGSALYVENWVLSAASVDYLDAENDPTPFQHYWSLSVEEQFYVGWPLLVIAALLLVRASTRAAEPRARLGAVGIALAVVTLASLVASIVLTPLSPAAAYFSTPLRAWEFGIGGLVAMGAQLGLRERIPAPARATLWGIGVTGILVASLALDETALFPGWVALVPVVATALALAGGLPQPAGAGLGRLPGIAAERIGTWSYSIYLWHWPAVVIALSLVGGPVDVGLGLAIVVGVIAISAATERWIERPFRENPRFRPPRAALAILIVGALISAGPAALAIARIDAAQDATVDQLEELIDELGANASGSGTPAPGGTPAPFPPAIDPALYPAPVDRLADTAGQYGCYLNAGEAYAPCGYGDPDAAIRIALVGDSHAASLVPALVPIVEAQGWRLEVMVGNACRLVPEPACVGGPDIATAVLTGDYAVVLATGVRLPPAELEATQGAWAPFLEAGVPIVPIVDVPTFPEATDACLSRVTDALDAARCWSPADAVAGPDAYGLAGAALGLPVIDLTAQFCRAGQCPAVIGNVIVYRDSPASHITATFSRTLSNALAAQLVPIVAAAS